MNTDTSKPTPRRIVQQVVLSVLLVLSVSAPTGHAVRTIVIARPSNMEHEQAHVQARMNRLSPDLPAHGTVGYVTHGYMHSKSDADYRCRMAQYRLAPLKLDAAEPLRHALVIGDFENDNDARTYVRRHDLSARRFAGSGLVVIEGTGR